jgi:hypothetical protein
MTVVVVNVLFTVSVDGITMTDDSWTSIISSTTTGLTVSL